jgi:hypothetical protein
MTLSAVPCPTPPPKPSRSTCREAMTGEYASGMHLSRDRLLESCPILSLY